MLDFQALVAAQPPIPVPVNLAASVELLNSHTRNDNLDISGRNFPQINTAAVQFLTKLSPVLQKAALSALFKQARNRFTTTTEATTFEMEYEYIHDRDDYVSLEPEIHHSAEPTTPVPTTSTTTTTTTERTTTATTAKQHIDDRKTVQQEYSYGEHASESLPPTFHWDSTGLKSSRSSWGETFGENIYQDEESSDVNRMGSTQPDKRGDAGIVLLIGVFNLLAVVVYAAHRHITNRPSLPPRVLDWQVQKVLDELVLRVHSSSGAAQLLARSLKDGDTRSAFTGRSLNSQNTLHMIKAAKGLLLSVAASPEASSTSALPPGMYRPLSALYSVVAKDLEQFTDTNDAEAVEGRSLNAVSKAPTWLQLAMEASQLNSIQWDGVLRTLTILGQSRSLSSSLTITRALMDALMTPEGTGRSLALNKINSLVSASLKKPEETSAFGNIDSLKAKLENSHSVTRRDVSNSRVMRKIGYVDDAGGLLGAAGEVGEQWSERWFSLVTRISPVLLDATTLYARAHSSPKCLRTLLCSMNYSWKKVGPLQSALTPLLSVLTGWALEDRVPHSLGESLAAIRAGWLGRDCSALYSECSIRRTSDDMLQQALTYFSKLEISVKESNLRTSTPSATSRRDHSPEIILYDPTQESVSKWREHRPGRGPQGHTPSFDTNIRTTDDPSDNDDDDTSSYEMYRQAAYGVNDAEYEGEYENDDSNLINSDSDNFKGHHSEQHVWGGGYQKRTGLSGAASHQNDRQRDNVQRSTSPMFEREDRHPKDSDGPHSPQSSENQRWMSSQTQHTPDASEMFSLYDSYDGGVDQGDNDSQRYNGPVDAGRGEDNHGVRAAVNSRDRPSNDERIDTHADPFVQNFRGEVYRDRQTTVNQNREKDKLNYVDSKKIRHHNSRDSFEMHQGAQTVFNKNQQPLSDEQDRPHFSFYTNSEHQVNSHEASHNLRNREPFTSFPKGHAEMYESQHMSSNEGSSNGDDQRGDSKRKGHSMVTESAGYKPRDLFRSNPQKISTEASRTPDSRSNVRKSAISVEKKEWYKSAYPHLYRVGSARVKTEQRRRPENPTSFTNFQRINSKMSKETGLDSSFETKQGIPPANTKQMQEHLALRNGNTKKSHEVIGNINTRITRVKPHKRGNQDKIKYKYGLRRGLPAVTVENFSVVDQQDVLDTSHLSHKSRPWYSYESPQSDSHRRRYSHAIQRGVRRRQRPTERPKDVAEFGPADAVTDSLRNSLLFEYIRDMKTDEAGTKEENKEQNKTEEVKTTSDSN